MNQKKLMTAARRLEQVTDTLISDSIRWHKTGEAPEANQRLHESVLNYIQCVKEYERWLAGE